MNLPEPLIYYRKRAGSMQLDDFWAQRQGVWRLAENQRRRAAGETPISSSEFAAKLAAAPALQRLKRRRQLWAMYYYRSGGTKFVNGRRVRGAAELVLASILGPARVRAGVANVLGSRRSKG
jgi:hypothetical protein